MTSRKLQQRGRPTSPAADVASDRAGSGRRSTTCKLTGSGAPFELRGRIDEQVGRVVEVHHFAGHSPRLATPARWIRRVARCCGRIGIGFRVRFRRSRRAISPARSGCEARRRARRGTPKDSFDVVAAAGEIAPPDRKIGPLRHHNRYPTMTAANAAGFELFDCRMVGLLRHGRGVARRTAARADVRQQHLRVGRHHHRVHAGACRIGYLAGGRMSMNAPSVRKLGLILIVAALTVLPLLLFAVPMLDAVAIAIPDPRFGSLLGATVLFFIPTVFSGMISPYAVRLIVQDRTSSGRHAGPAVFRVDVRQRRRHVADVVLPGAADGSESHPAGTDGDLRLHRGGRLSGTRRSECAVVGWLWLLSAGSVRWRWASRRADDMKLLHSERSLYREVLVYETGSVRCICFTRFCRIGRQTCQDVKRPDRIVMNYPQMMLGVAVRQARAALGADHRTGRRHHSSRAARSGARRRESMWSRSIRR